VTFSVLGTDGNGRFGMAVCSSSPAVAARCIHLRPGVGGAASQNVTDPRLGPALLDALSDLGDAAAALERVLAAAGDDRKYRQLMVLDAKGSSRSYSGGQTLGTHASAGVDAAVAAGNMLATDAVPTAMLSAFTTAGGELEERLLAALRAGLDAGGEEGPVHSAGLSVVAEVDWRVTDLRVDWHEEPVTELARLLDVWLPQRDDYVQRGLDPAASPSYGVPGDR
jgi:uncharacterized Ntn-hydrolase superfamily protein